jgi:putative ubiquitin-RnfH superfamily antitoxin RatB of RatAB toxin-antitoxin module
MPPDSPIHVEIAGAPGGLDGLVALSLPAGARIADALAALGLEASDAAGLGVWGRRAAPDTTLEDGDRIECYRALQVDPKAARRTRASNKR